MASAGRDRGLRLWDLMRGTSAASLSTNEAVEALVWSVDGNFIAALGPKELLVLNVSSNAVTSYRDPNSSGLTFVSLTAMIFLRGMEVLVGDGKGELRVLEPGSNGGSLVEVCKLPAQDGTHSRVKALARGIAPDFFVVGMSSGRIETWSVVANVKANEDGAFRRLWVVETGVRLTCLAMWLVSDASVGEMPTGKPVVATTGVKTTGRKRKRRKNTLGVA